MTKNNKNKSETPSILSKGFKVQGDIKSSGILEIEGATKGTIKGSEVIIREDGKVEGLIEADILSIHGSFNGEIKANSINIFKKASIIGTIEYGTISVEDGACIDGQFKKINSQENIIKVANENTTSDKSKLA